MLKAQLLRLHRWVALVFALPVLVVVATGLILSFEPIVEASSVTPGSVSAEKLTGALAKFDPQGRARGFSVDPRLGIMTLQGVGEDGSTDVSLVSGEEVDVESALSDLFSTARSLHQRLIFRMRWLVTASAFAMLVLATIGVFMGFSRLRNNFSGWHKAVAWGLFPLVVLSPLTGLFLAFNVGIGGPAGVPGSGRGQARAPQMPIAEAAQLAVAAVDPATILSLGVRGGRMIARVAEHGEVASYIVSKSGMVRQPANWPRTLHVGAGLWTGLLNVVASFAILVLLCTGVTIWARREWRIRNRRRATVSKAAAVA